MANVRTRFPKVFIGHPFKKRFPVESFRKLFRELPFTVIYGNTDIQTKHLLSVIKGQINKVDYCIFDLTYWNPNVSLELGLVEGMKNKPSKPYYVIIDTNKSKDVPSDVKGLQRLEYTKIDYSINNGLGDQLLMLLKKEYWAKKILLRLRQKLTDHSKLEKGFLGSMKMIGHLKEFENLTSDNIKSLFRGTRLHANDKNIVIESLVEVGIIKSTPTGYQLNNKKKVFG